MVGRELLGFSFGSVSRWLGWAVLLRAGLLLYFLGCLLASLSVGSGLAGLGFSRARQGDRGGCGALARAGLGWAVKISLSGCFFFF